MYIQRHIIGAATALVAFTALAPAAFAGESNASEDTRQVLVSFRKSELSQDAGAKAVLGRIESAASKACRRNGERTLQDRGEFHRCRRMAVAGAVRKVNRPMLTAAHTGKAPIALAQKEGQRAAS